MAQLTQSCESDGDWDPFEYLSKLDAQEPMASKVVRNSEEPKDSVAHLTDRQRARPAACITIFSEAHLNSFLQLHFKKHWNREHGLSMIHYSLLGKSGSDEVLRIVNWVYDHVDAQREFGVLKDVNHSYQDLLRRVAQSDPVFAGIAESVKFGLKETV
jgi:hypothetical protein